MKSETVILTNFPFDQTKIHCPEFHEFSISDYGLIAYLRLVLGKEPVGLFISQPSGKIMIANVILKLFLRAAIFVVYYDLILQKPTNNLEYVVARIKGFLLNKANFFYFLQKDLSGYVRYYHLDLRKARFVPFKVNNMEYIKKIESEDGGYIFSAGVSHRDYKMLFSVIGELGYKCKVVIPMARVGIHNTIIANEDMPDNIQVIIKDVDYFTWNELLAKSKFVVLPILEGTLQPAGISVCLESMAFGKAVVISRGTSVNGMITKDEVEIFEASDKESMKQAISIIWNDSDRRKMIAKNGRKFALCLGGKVDLQRRLIEQLVNDGLIH